MAYVEPATVWAPKSSIRSVHNSLQLRARRLVRCKHRLGGSEAIGIRWNGKDGPGIGNPQSRGNATWFILPGTVKEVILSRIDDLAMSGPEINRGIRGDGQRCSPRREAEEWSEG